EDDWFYFITSPNSISGIKLERMTRLEAMQFATVITRLLQPLDSVRGNFNHNGKVIVLISIGVIRSQIKDDSSNGD
ncbi:hypothetical protein NPIL_43281, partial [Nephila pilipes]